MKIGKKAYVIGIFGILLLVVSIFFVKGSSIKATETKDDPIFLEQTTTQVEETTGDNVYFSLNITSAKKNQRIFLNYPDSLSFKKEKLLEMNKGKITFIQIDHEKSQMELILEKESEKTTLYLQGTTNSEEIQTIQAISEQNRSNKLEIGKKESTIPETSTSLSEKKEVPKSRSKSAASYSDEWTEIFTAEEAIIPAGVGKELRYGFGPTDALGKTSISGNRQKQFAIPNVTFMDNNKRVQHIYHTPSAVAKPEEAGQSLWTSYGLIYAYGNNTNPKVFNTGSHITSEGYKYYKRELPNGMIIYKLTYDSVFDSKKFHVEIIMTGKTTGTVNVDYTITNIGSEKAADFVIGSMIDTELNKNDQVPVYAIGNNKGVYIKDDGDNGYKLQYLFDGPDHALNWTGKHWIQGTSAFPRDYFLNLFFNFDDSGFSALNSTGYEVENHPADKLVYVTNDINKMDTAIFMKNQPTSLDVNQGTKMTYDVTIGLSGNPPEVFIDQKDQELIQGKSDFDVTGQWSDSESKFVDLFYTLDDGEAVKFGSKVPNDMANPGKKMDWKFTLPSSALTIGKRVIKVYAVDSEGHTSEEKILNLTIKSGKATLTVEFLDEENRNINPDITLVRDVGSFVYLTKEPAVAKVVKDKLDEVYEIVSRPTPEDAIEVLENGLKVTYRFKGGIALISAPKEIYFGTQIVKAQESLIEEPVRIDGALVIQDSRATKKPWKLQARMKQELTNSNNQVVTNAIRYMYSGNEVKLNSGMQDIAVGTNVDGSPNKVSDKWSAKGDGFKLKTEIGAVKESGSYVGIIEWELLDGP
ncbi:hypothetical protein ACWOC1_12605 [Enterococcus quebecensis]|uniref:WxL domain-containing protein n=1 Tax=Enterococcus quebecensis TaxID=903983 RepID=A0A1E5H315_9ENTE|nr:hypothetical protein [Enterococcus quebecensis]OEG19274.1 hypothetical protein BCR23_00875 [Enterococcus quebecensis]OJG75812.1 hypothetical protein RV12_GL000151 [Enterococcus quebecensis]